MKKSFIRIACLLLLAALLVASVISCDKNDSISNDAQSSEEQSTAAESSTSTEAQSQTTAQTEAQTQKSFADMSEKERARYIVSIQLSELPSISSYTARGTITMLGTYMGYEIDANADLLVKAANIRSSTNLNMVMSMDMTIDTMGERQTASMMQGYANGNMFESSREVVSNEISEYKIRTPLSASEYISYSKAVNESSDFFNIALTEANCHSISCKENADGSFTATFSDFTASGMKEIDDTFGGMFLFDDEIDGATLKLTVDKDLLPKNVQFETSYKNNSDTTISFDIDYVDFNATSATEMNFDGYKVIKDMRLIGLTKQAMDNAFTNKSTKFDYAGTLEVLQNGSPVVEQGNNYKFSFANTANGFEFEYDGTSSEGKDSGHYKDGSFVDTDTSNGAGTPVELSENLARQLMKPYLDPASLSADILEDAERSGNECLFTIKDPNLSQFENLIYYMGAEEDDVDIKQATLSVKLRNGNFESYVYKLKLEIEGSDGRYVIDYSVNANNFKISEK